jgi:DNA-3-methyladenine glycosylase II
MTPEFAKTAEQELQKLDPRLGELIRLQGSIYREPRHDYFASLTRAITGQQLSVAAAATIYKRLEDQTALDPQNVAVLTEEETKRIGLSRPKARYIQDLAQHFVHDSAVFNHLETLSDDHVIEELTKIKGIGVWTAQMFLMFTLIRPDVFAPDDVGLQRAVVKLYGLNETPARSELEALAEQWKPYRTVASWHLWESLNNTPSS